MTTDQRITELNKKMDVIISMLAGRSDRPALGDLSELKRRQKEKCMAIKRQREAA